MTDYGNSNKSKEEKKKPDEKNVEKVITGEVIVQKKGIGRKFKDIFIEADFKSVISYVGTDVLLPALRNMIVDGASRGVERMMYGDTISRRRGYHGTGSRISYNSSPINRGYSGHVGPSSRPALPPGRPSSRGGSRDDFILSSRDEADLVLERMNDIIDQYEFASVGDLNELVGFPSTHVDQKWGWVYLGDVKVRQVREGYLLDLPPAEPIQ